MNENHVKAGGSYEDHETLSGSERHEEHGTRGSMEGREDDQNGCPQCYYDKPEEQTTVECPQCHYEREAEQGEETETECPQCHYRGRAVEKVHKKGNPQGFYGNR